MYLVLWLFNPCIRIWLPDIVLDSVPYMYPIILESTTNHVDHPSRRNPQDRGRQTSVYSTIAQ